MTPTSVTGFFFLALLMQAPFLPDRPIPAALTEEDRAKLLSEQKVENRIKIYAKASLARGNAIRKAIDAQGGQDISAILSSWTELLEYSLEDIRINVGRKSKSKALRKFEIELRKSISDVNDLKMKGTVEQLGQFESWLKHAEDVRSRFVEFLFPG